MNVRPPFPMDLRIEYLEYKSLKVEELEQIASILYQEAQGHQNSTFSYIILFHDNSQVVKVDPSYLNDISNSSKRIKSFWADFRTESDNKFITIRIDETLMPSRTSFMQVAGDDIKWLHSTFSRLVEITKPLDNGTEKIYNLNFISRLLIFFFNIIVIGTASYGLLQLAYTLFKLDREFSIFLFIIFFQTLFLLIPIVTTEKVLASLRQLRPSIEIITKQSNWENLKGKFIFSFAVYVVLPFILSILLALIFSGTLRSLF